MPRLTQNANCHCHALLSRCIAPRCIASDLQRATLSYAHRLTICNASRCTDDVRYPYSFSLLPFPDAHEQRVATIVEGLLRCLSSAGRRRLKDRPRAVHGGLGWRSLEQGNWADSAPFSCNTFAGARRAELSHQAHSHRAARSADGWLWRKERLRRC